MPSLDALEAEVHCVAVLAGAHLAGYAATLPGSNTLCQLAVDREYRRRGVGSCLMAAAHHSDGAELGMLNADARDQGLQAFLLDRGARKTVEQIELFLEF